MANVTKPIILDETGQAIVEKLDAIADAMTPPTAADIATSAITGEDNVEDALGYLDDKIDEQTAGVVKSVNAIHPDEHGEVKITNVAYSDNFTSDKTQNSEGEFIIRTAGGDASISDGDAFVTRVYGNRVHTGYSPESLNMEVTMTPRVAPDPITAALDAETFEAYVSEAGIYTLTYTSSWSADPSLYGVTVTGTPLSGDSIEIDWDGESEPYMTVTAPRVAPDGISATINRDMFVGYVSESGMTTLTYTTMWSANPALYGVTVTGTPVSGDYITITYYKEQRGTIAVATPSAFKSTWWNLYDHTAGYAYLTKYSTQYGFRIGGTYTALQYSETPTGTKSSITPVDGVFTIPGDGYVWVTGGNNTNTYIINQWSDWTDGPAGDFEAYSEITINLATIMNTYFPYGLLRVGVVRDEINVNASLAISKIDRMAYNAENLASAKASGRAYEYDSNYIYIVKASYDSNSITLDGDYMASDHGNEFFVGTSVPVYLETMYGNNLKNKLERDVVTISQQTLTSAQQTQVRNNLSAASQADITTLNGRIFDTPTQEYNGDLNLLTSVGMYLVGSEATNTPPNKNSGKLKVEKEGTINYIRQTYSCGYTNHIYTRVRYYVSGSWYWNNWEEITSSTTTHFIEASYANTTISAIEADLNSKFGGKYAVCFSAYDLTDGQPSGQYIALRNTNYSNAVRFICTSTAGVVNLSPKDMTSSLSKHSTYVGTTNTKVYKVSNMAIWSINFQILQEAPVNTELFTGGPKPVAAVYSSLASSAGAGIRVRVKTNGALDPEEKIPAGWYNGCIIYPV